MSEHGLPIILQHNSRVELEEGVLQIETFEFVHLVVVLGKVLSAVNLQSKDVDLSMAVETSENGLW